MRAGKLGIEKMFFFRVHIQRDDPPVSQAQCGFQALGKALLNLGLDLHTINDDINIVLLSLF